MSLLFGGYLVTQRLDRPPSMCAELLPPRILTASNCIASFVPDVWALDWTGVAQQERERSACALGIDLEALPDLVRYITARFNEGDFGWPNVVTSSEALIRLMDRLPATDAWVVLGLGLHRKHVTDFLGMHAPVGNHGDPGVFAMLAQMSPLPPGGTILGFEPLRFDGGSEPHSWLCNGLETECFQALGIRPGPNGLIEAEDEAERATAHISKEEVGAEPAQRLPWMLVDYTEVSASDGPG